MVVRTGYAYGDQGQSQLTVRCARIEPERFPLRGDGWILRRVNAHASRFETAVESLRRAACETARAGGVRVWGETALGPPSEESRVLSMREGIADVASRRVDFTETVGPAAAESMRRATRMVWERIPWLLTDEEFEDFQSPITTYAQRVFVGGQRFDSHPYFHTWYYETGDLSRPRRRPDDPLWIIDVLQWVDEASHIGSGEVRGVACNRLGFHVDLELHRGALAVPRTGVPLGAPHLAGEAWVDESSRLRRVSFVQIPRRRPRFGVDVCDPDQRTRTTLELWDFGIPVSIEVPEIEGPKFGAAQMARLVFHVAQFLQRRKREYGRQQETSEGT
jgi:hypothetical protein